MIKTLNSKEKDMRRVASLSEDWDVDIFFYPPNLSTDLDGYPFQGYTECMPIAK
jgi:hypothetical protein